MNLIRNLQRMEIPDASIQQFNQLLFMLQGRNATDRRDTIWGARHGKGCTTTPIVRGACAAVIDRPPSAFLNPHVIVHWARADAPKISPLWGVHRPSRGSTRAPNVIIVLKATTNTISMRGVYEARAYHSR